MQPTDDLSTKIAWPEDPQFDSRTQEQWKVFCAQPFKEDVGYLSYVAELGKISVTYKKYMSKKNSDGDTALQLLRNGASRKHYEGLQNTSRLLALLGS